MSKILISFIFVLLLGILAISIAILVLNLQSSNEINDENVDINNTVIVKIESGQIRGFKRFTIIEEKPYYSFRGIPFAQTPIDELRFKVSIFNSLIRQHKI